MSNLDQVVQRLVETNKISGFRVIEIEDISDGDRIIPLAN